MRLARQNSPPALQPRPKLPQSTLVPLPKASSRQNTSDLFDPTDETNTEQAISPTPYGFHHPKKRDSLTQTPHPLCNNAPCPQSALAPLPKESSRQNTSDLFDLPNDTDDRTGYFTNTIRIPPHQKAPSSPKLPIAFNHAPSFPNRRSSHCPRRALDKIQAICSTRPTKQTQSRLFHQPYTDSTNPKNSTRSPKLTRPNSPPALQPRLALPRLALVPLPKESSRQNTSDLFAPPNDTDGRTGYFTNPIRILLPQKCNSLAKTPHPAPQASPIDARPIAQGKLATKYKRFIRPAQRHRRQNGLFHQPIRIPPPQKSA